MTSVTTTRRIDLQRLTDEVGTGLRMHGDGDSDQDKVITAPASVTSATLQAAVDSHVWVDRAGNAASIRQAVRQHMDTLDTILGSSGTLTAAQLSNAVRVLARGQKHLIRLTVGALDATD